MDDTSTPQAQSLGPTPVAETTPEPQVAAPTSETAETPVTPETEA